MNRTLSLFSRWLLAALLLGSATVAAAEAETAEYRLLFAAVNERILPAHQQLQQQTKVLNQAAHGFCNKPSASSLSALRSSWVQAMLAWETLAVLDFGPVETTNARFLFQFWPDPLNLVERKLASRIAGKNPDISAGQLAKASVAIQGLSAMEYLLFDDKVAKVRNYASRKHLCQILTATSGNLEANAVELNRLWKVDFAQRFYSLEVEKSHPGYFYLNLEKLFASLVSSLEIIKNQKLGAALGLAPVLPTALPGEATPQISEPRAPNPLLLECWRSQTSLKQIKANLQFGLGLYEMPHGFSWYLIQQSPASAALDQQIKAEYSSAIAQIDAIDSSAFSLLQHHRPQALLQLHATISSLSQRLQLEYTKAAQIDYRFNARDGD